jgi:hypothetical protein
VEPEARGTLHTAASSASWRVATKIAESARIVYANERTLVEPRPARNALLAQGSKLMTRSEIHANGLFTSHCQWNG